MNSGATGLNMYKPVMRTFKFGVIIPLLVFPSAMPIVAHEAS